MTDDVDPIRVAGDDGVILDETADGAIACVEDGDGLLVHVDPDSELGELLTWHAGHRAESPDDLLADAIEEFIASEQTTETRTDGGPAVRCPNSHEFGRGEAASATFDGSEARYQCPACGAWSEGPPPG